MLYLPDKVTPSHANGYARRKALSANPGLWSSLAGYWSPLLGPTGLLLHDVGGGNPDGVLTNMVPSTDWVQTEMGWALDFGIRGTQDVVEITSPALPGDLTIAFLFRPGSTTDTCYVSDFSGQNEFACVCGFQAGQYNVFGGSYPFGGVAAASQIPVSGVGIWDLVAWTKRGTTLTGYVNGRQYVQDTITGGDFTPSANFKLGRGWANFTDSVNGLIAMYSLHARALAPSEIQQLHVDPLAPLRRRPLVLPTAAAAPPAFAGRNIIIGGGIVA